jgi:hypothetical protein
LSIYPIPASEKIRIKSLQINGIVTFTVTDMNGKVLIARSMKQNGIVEQDISSLPAGIYFVNLANGSVAYHGKFVVVK